MRLDYKKIDNIEMDDVYTWDYPDFCDAFIESADYNGNEMTDKQLEEIHNNSDFVYECVLNYIQ